MEIYTIGGYSEVGKNMTVVDMGEDAIMFDAGLFLPPIVELEEVERNKTATEKKLRSLGAIPDDTILDRTGVRGRIRAILLGHAHLDHIGAIPYMSNRYNAEIVGTPFTTEVLKTIIRDENLRINNQIKTVQPNSSYFIQGKNRKYRVDFINITHSTIQTSLIALHTRDGVVLYANDFKLDNNPIVGKKPNYEKINEIKKQGVKALIVDSLYSSQEGKTPSEKIARYLLEEVMLTTDNKKAGMVVTTFSSHIARLKSIVDFGKQLNRKVVFVGRSLSKYTNAAKRVNLCPFANDVEIASYSKQREAILKKVNNNRKNYLVVCTGHQGEPGSVLDRISKNQLPLAINPGDHVIFSSKVIPTPINISNRDNLDKKLKKKGARIFTSAHVSGHAFREDLRDFINLVSPQHIIPAHGDAHQLSGMNELASELGYKYGKDIHLMHDLQSIKLK